MYPKVKPFWIYTVISFFKTFSSCECVCVCVKILNILKRKNSGLIPHWKMSELRGLKFVLCIQELGPFGYSQLLASLRFSPLLPMCVY